MALDYSNLSGECIAIVFVISLGCAFEYEGNMYVVNEFHKTIYKGTNELELNNNIKSNIGFKYSSCISSNYGMYSYLEFELASGTKRIMTILNCKIPNLSC